MLLMIRSALRCRVLWISQVKPMSTWLHWIHWALQCLKCLQFVCFLAPLQRHSMSYTSRKTYSSQPIKTIKKQILDLLEQTPRFAVILLRFCFQPCSCIARSGNNGPPCPRRGMMFVGF
jgi:hypothetical protein